MPSKVSKTKLRMRMTRTTSVKLEPSSQPPAKTMKSSIESYHHVQRQRSQENCSRSSDTNSNTSISNSKISTKRNESSGKKTDVSRSESNSLLTPVKSANSGSSHNYHSQVKKSRAPKSHYHQGPNHHNTHSHEQSGAAGGHHDDKSSQSSNSSDEKHCELDGPIYKRYNIKTRLGKGAYGIVWEAYEKTTGNKVALKKIFDAFRNDTDAQRTYREIMFLREFGSHPNIIRLLNVHRAVNNMDIYLVFPFMEHDLHRLIKESPQLLKDSHIRMVFYQTLKAVKYLHSGEVIHRDLKPANILLDDYLNVKVGDFGLARSLSNPEDTMSETNPIMTDYVATRWYRPPEILLSCPFYTKGVDMWSLGCILAEMILKAPLFPGGSTVHQVETIMGHIAPPSAEEIEKICYQNVQSTMIESAMVYRKKPLAEIFERSDADTVDIIEKLLVFNPSRRVTAEETLSHPYLARYRRQTEEITMSHPVSPPLNDYIQLPMCQYRSVIYDLIQVRKVRLQQQQQQPHSQFQQQTQNPQPSSQGHLQQSQPQQQLQYQQEVSESPVESPVPKSRSYSQPTITQTTPALSYSSPNNSNEPRRIRPTNNTQTGVSTTTTLGPNPSASIAKPNSRKEKEKEGRKSYNTVKTSQTLSREKVLTASSCDHSERMSKGDTSSIGPEGDGNGAQKVRTYVGTSHNYKPNPVCRTGDTANHKPTRKNNSTPNIPQVRKIPGPDGDGHNLPLPYLKLVSTAPVFQGKNPRSELSARTSHPIPSDLRGADKRLFEIFCNTDDLEEEIKAIEFQVRAKRANNSVQVQWITDLSNNLNKATVSDIPNNFTNSTTQNQVLGITNTGQAGIPPGQLPGGNVKGQRHQLTKLPEILQSWNQGHSKMSMNLANTETGAKQPRRSTYFQDPPGQVTSSNSGTVNVLSAKGGGLRNVGATRLTQLSPRELILQQRQGHGSFQNSSGPQQQQLPRSTTPIEVIQSRNKHYESYSQTHGTISASDLTELKANLGFLSK